MIYLAGVTAPNRAYVKGNGEEEIPLKVMFYSLYKLMFL